MEREGAADEERKKDGKKSRRVRPTTRIPALGGKQTILRAAEVPLSPTLEESGIFLYLLTQYERTITDSFFLRYPFFRSLDVFLFLLHVKNLSLAGLLSIV